MIFIDFEVYVDISLVKALWPYEYFAYRKWTAQGSIKHSYPIYLVCRQAPLYGVLGG